MKQEALKLETTKPEPEKIELEKPEAPKPEVVKPSSGKKKKKKKGPKVEGLEAKIGPGGRKKASIESGPKKRPEPKIKRIEKVTAEPAKIISRPPTPEPPVVQPVSPPQPPPVMETPPEIRPRPLPGRPLRFNRRAAAVPSRNLNASRPGMPDIRPAAGIGIFARPLARPYRRRNRTPEEAKRKRKAGILAPRTPVLPGKRALEAKRLSNAANSTISPVGIGPVVRARRPGL